MATIKVKFHYIFHAKTSNNKLIIKDNQDGKTGKKINFSLKKTEGVSKCKNKFKITVYIYYKNSVKRCFSLIYVDQGT
jgi:hypothetical protein